jgi:ATP synthase protein I
MGKPTKFMRAAQLASVGLEMGVAVAIGYGIGWWADKRFGTKPWLMLVGVMVGVAAGFKALYDSARKLSQDLKD